LISILLNCDPLVPSIFILYAEDEPPIIFKEDNRNFRLFSFLIINVWYVEPAATKTVSYFSVSVLIKILASGLVMNVSFLQEKRRINRRMVSIPGIFIDFKNNRRKRD
jgi:hypothetical protein